MGSKVSKYEYKEDSWDDMMEVLQDQTIRILLIGTRKVGKTTLKNKVGAILRNVIIHEDSNPSLDQNYDGVILVFDVEDLSVVGEYFLLYKRAHKQSCVIVFITHTDLATSDELQAIVSMSQVAESEVFYAPIHESQQDSDYTVLSAIYRICSENWRR